MNAAEDRKTEREITYQVGWRRGSIHYKDKQPSAGSPPVPTPSGRADQAARWACKYLWREAPYPNGTVLAAFLWAVPAVGFATVVWLVYRLASVS